MRLDGASAPGSAISRRARSLAARGAAAAAVACAVLAPLAVHWLAGRTLAWFDTTRLFAPQRWLVDEALRAFRLPLWNPFMGGGVPFLADAIHGVLHPLSILTAWLGTGRSMDVLIGGYTACAGLGAALLARDLGASRGGAAAAGFAYGMSGYVLSMSCFLNLLAGAGSLPFCLAGLRRFAADPRPGSLAFGAAGTAVLAFSGDVQGLMVAGPLALTLAWEAGGWRGAVRATGAGLAGLAVAGIQLVPSAAHLPRTVRAAETWIPNPDVWALEPWRIPELVVPGLLWGPDPLMDRVYGALAGPGRWIGLPKPFAASVFVGLLPVALAWVGVGQGRRGRLLGMLSLVLLWIALGPTLGASAVLAHVPVWRAFQYPEKLVAPLTLVLAVLAGLGLDAAVEQRVARGRVLAVAAALGAASVGACLLASSRLAPDLASMMAARIARGAWHALCAALALGAWLLLRGRLGAAGGRAGLAAAVWLGMAAASPAALRPGDPTARLRAPGPRIASAPPGPRIVTPYTYEPLSTGPGLDWLDQAARDHASKGYVAYNVRSRLDSLDRYMAMTPRRLEILDAAFGARWPEAARRYAVTHVVVDVPRSEAHRFVHDIATRGGTLVDSVPGDHEVWAVPHREWASFPPEVRVVDGERAAVLATAAAFAARSPAAIVEAWSRFDAAPGRVLSTERGLESVRVEAESDADATLVVADAWWPGWEATLDGLPVPIFRADVLVRAVRWPAGRHVLDMRYRPPEARAGLAASAVGIALTTAWLAVLRRRRPEPGGAERG